MKKIIHVSIIAILLIPIFLFSQTNPGFESGDLTGWIDAHTGAESISTSYARTGIYGLNYSTNNSTNQRMENLLGISVPNSSYLHCIGWAVGSNSDAKAGITIFNGTGWDGATSLNIGTTLTRLSHSRRNNSGVSIENFQIGLNSSKITNTTVLYWDDVVAYVSTSSTTDLIAPNSATSVSSSSNETGTSITVTWTDGADAGTGSQQALILRANGRIQSPPTLNDQGRYSVAGGSDGPNTVGSWIVVGIVNTGVQTFTDNTTSANTDYTYAVYMRDLAYNYSAGTSSSIHALPVELTSFTSLVNGNTVTLNWETATEINNYGFEILRSAKNDKWEKVGFVQGSGNSYAPKQYSFNDKPLGAKEFNYHLKQIDFDGSFEYSNVIDVVLEEINEFKLVQNYPNPFNPTTVIGYQLPTDGFVKLKIFDSIGREVAVLVNENKQAGLHETKFDGSKLNSGIYFYRIESGSYVDSKKLILIK